MTTTVQILLTLHILSALVAVGATVSYFFWMRRTVLVPESRKFTLETLRLLELRMVSPAYVILFLTGLGLIDRASWGWATPWLELSILLFIVLMGLVGFHTRLIRRQIALTEDESSDPAEYDASHNRGRILMLAKVVVIIALVYLMVFKPPLWG